MATGGLTIVGGTRGLTIEAMCLGQLPILEVTLPTVPFGTMDGLCGPVLSATLSLAATQGAAEVMTRYTRGTGARL